ncbi:hypothetical protein SH668x_001746 [Planctomicrobium sp. SH668]|uniref:hypothetical protein n=1 Tax=Planctomicrobium sp. SH668 TaxID=3448126 RepID=UPI003F5C1FDD
MAASHTTPESSPIPSVRAKPLWSKLESLISTIVIVIVIIFGWKTFTTLHELFTPVKRSSSTSQSTLDIPLLQRDLSTHEAGFWRVKDCEWALAMRIDSTARVIETLEKRKSNPPPQRFDSADISKLTEAIKYLSPAHELGENRYLYEHTSGEGKFGLITKKIDDQEVLEYAMAAVPTPAASGMYQVFEVGIPTQIRLSQQRFLLPVTDSAQETCSRNTIDGEPALQILEVPESIEQSVLRWKNAGWVIEQQQDVRFGTSSYLCTLNNSMILACVLRTTAGKHDLLLLQCPIQMSTDNK